MNADQSSAHGHEVSTVQTPPASLWGALRRIGPGLIIAGSIVGSGELIGTTKVGAEAGFVLLWLILVGCVIKVFVQVEFGRYTIVSGKSSMQGLNEVPGPRLVVNWLIWYWLIMFSMMTAQLGGIAGGVGQSLAIAFPVSNDYRTFATTYGEERKSVDDDLRAKSKAAGEAVDDKKIAAEAGRNMDARLKQTRDDTLWTGFLAVITSVLLVVGRYRMVEYVSTFLVAGFTLVTIAGVVALQLSPDTAFSWADVWQGLQFQLPKSDNVAKSLATALATFGIIGVGASELIAYPYWCLEKGYARYTGPRSDRADWADRARGWLRVLRVDVWCSMVIYTLATLAFFFLGAAVLHRQHLIVTDEQMIPVLAAMYQNNPLFGGIGEYVFYFGAFAVLYSTFFVATAGNARMAGDAARLFGVIGQGDEGVRRFVRVLCGLLPVVSFFIYWWSKKTVTLVLLSGLTQGFMLPMLGLAALWFRYRRGDERVNPGRVWDVFLWISVLGLGCSGLYGVYAQLPKLMSMWAG